MSSNIPTRRVTRAARLPNENAVKGRVPFTHGIAKPGATVVAGPSKPTTSGTTLDVNAQNKRKREALGEVTNNKNKNVPKGISKDGKIVKPHVLIATKPARTTVRKTRAAIISKEVEVKEEEVLKQDEDAMLVDEPAPLPTLHRVTRRLTSRTSTTVAATSTTSVTANRTTQSPLKRGVATELAHLECADEEQVDEEDTQPVSKKRRTSSEADVEAVVETEVEEKASTVNNAHKFTDALASPPNVEDDGDNEEVTGWEDLDAEDFDDPTMVSEYVVDIFKYLSECEDQTLPNPNYMQHQGELKWSHRGVLMDYLIGLHYRFRMIPETLYLAVNIIDRFLSMRVVSLSKLQLVGLCGLFIASKFEEIMAPSVKNLLVVGAIQDDAKEEDMLKAERYILKTLNWTVSLFPQPMNWLRRISKADDYESESRSLAKFFLEIHVVERKLLGIKPSLVAAASMWLGRLVTNQIGWTPNLRHYSGYSEEKIIPVANIMLNYCLRPERHENLTQKYSSRKYGKVAVYIHDWVTARWTVGDKISLLDELPYLIALAEESKA